MYFGEIGHFTGGFELHYVAQPHSQVFSDGLVHAYFAIVELVIDERHHESLLALLTFD